MNAVPRELPRPRPLLVPAIALIAGIALSDAIGPLSATWRTGIVALPPLAILFLLPAFRRRAHRHVLLALAAIIALAAGIARHQQLYDRPPHHIVHALREEPTLTRLAGRIVTTPSERPPLKLNPFLPFSPPPRTQFVLAVDELRTTDPPTPATGNLRVSIEAADLGLGLGERVQLTGRAWRLFGPQNPGEQDWSHWYRQQGIDAGLTVEASAHVQVLPDSVSVWPPFLTALRHRAQSLLYEPYADLMPAESARLLDVMILGQRSTADQAMNEAFLRAGGMHFLAVSGFNVMVLAVGVWWIVGRLLHASDALATVAAVLATLLFALIAEPNAPVLRAVIAVVLVALARAMRRPVCALNSLALAASGMLVWNPNQLFQAAFQLTFVQVLVLIVVVPRVYSLVFYRRSEEGPPPEALALRQVIWRTFHRWAGGLVLVCACTWASALPLVLWHFGRFTPWGWLGTVPLTPLVTLVTVLSMLTLAANALVPPLGVGLGFVLARLIDWLLRSVRLFEHVPGAVLYSQPPPLLLVIATYGVLLFLVAARRTPEQVHPRPATRRSQSVRGLTLAKVDAVVLLVLAWLGWMVLPPSRSTGHAVHVLAAGNGNTVLLTASDGGAAVLDVGTDTNSDIGATAARALRALGMRAVDAVLVSHGNFDHYSGLPTLLSSMKVGRWMANPYFADPNASNRALAELVARLPPAYRQPGALHAGDQCRVGEATLDVLWPPADLDATWSANDQSLAVRVTVNGRAVLLTGDLERRSLAALLDAEREGRLTLHADVLVTPHHGQVIPDVTERFLAAVSPQVVVVSARTPRPKMKKLVESTLGPQARVLLTGEVGAVTVRVTPAGDLAVETPFAPAAP